MIHARNVAFRSGLSHAAHSLPNTFFDGLWLQSRPDSGAYMDPFSKTFEMQALDDPFPGGNLSSEITEVYDGMWRGGKGAWHQVSIPLSQGPVPSPPDWPLPASTIDALLDDFTGGGGSPAEPPIAQRLPRRDLNADTSHRAATAASLTTRVDVYAPCLHASILDAPVPHDVALCAPLLLDEPALLSAPPAPPEAEASSYIMLLHNALHLPSQIEAELSTVLPSPHEQTCDEPLPLCAPSTLLYAPSTANAPSSLHGQQCEEPQPMCAPSKPAQPALSSCDACRPKRGVRGGRRGHRARYLQSYC